ncbi:winged helix-turn-helix transcriptional regulator [Amycolatopsis sp. NPDC059090]|uniref:winged helix-turn-helix transcriptional regulator n=1 Tax=unclassified Amycolatopsis TaxID=2618356 RepID=UPI0036716C4B
MSRQNMSYQKTFESAVEMLRGRWMIVVLAALSTEDQLQYRDIRDRVNEGEVRPGNGDDVSPLSDQSLTKTLKRAQDHGLVRLHADEGHFKPTWYELTRKGAEALRAVRPLIEWMHRYEPAPNH